MIARLFESITLQQYNKMMKKQFPDRSCRKRVSGKIVLDFYHIINLEVQLKLLIHSNIILRGTINLAA